MLALSLIFCSLLFVDSWIVDCLDQLCRTQSYFHSSFINVNHVDKVCKHANEGVTCCEINLRNYYNLMHSAL